MIDHVSDLQWDRLLAGELSADAIKTARAHAERCVACSARLHELTAERDAFRLRPTKIALSRASLMAEASVAGTRTVDMVGATLSGRYLVTRKIGQGGMGAVYEATHTIIGKRVAVKVLLEKYAKRDAIVARLKKEAQLASSVQNEHIIDVTDFGQTEDGRTFVVMEFLEGESLAECLAREPRLPEQRVLRIAHQAASALAAAHKEGIVHRDIKPENLFLLRRKEQDFVKVVDFGISKSLRASGEEEEPPRLTQSGMVIGTPLYMSPEQARGDDKLDHRVDIYALGVIMYEAATGRVPFIGNNDLSVISQVLNEEARTVRELCPELSEEFEAIVMRAMSKDRRKRYGRMQEMLADLTALLDLTHSTERAKITGPRQKLPRKSSLNAAVWVGAIALVVIALIFAVNFTVGGPSTGMTALAPSLDAAPPHADASVPPDAPEQIRMVELRIETVPPGATIIKDGVPQGEVTPTTVEFVDKEKDVKFILQLDGYNDHEFSVNPKEKLPAGNKFTFTLKLEKGVPVVRPFPRSGGERDGVLVMPLLFARRGGELTPFFNGVILGDSLQAGYTANRPGFGAVLLRDDGRGVMAYVPSRRDAMVPLPAGARGLFPQSRILDDVLGRIAVVWCQTAHPLAPLLASLRESAAIVVPGDCVAREFTFEYCSEPGSDPRCRRVATIQRGPSRFDSVLGRVVGREIQGGDTVLKIGAGSDQGIAKTGWRAMIVNGNDKPVPGGEVTIVRVDRTRVVGKTKLTAGQVNANPQVKFVPSK